MKAKAKGILAVFASLSLVFLLFSAYPHLTAFFGLSASNSNGKAPATQPNSAAQSNEVPATQEALGVGLSFKVLKKTVISTNMETSPIISDCPETTELELAIKNTGEFPAKKISIRFPPMLKVVACENCGIESLEPFQETKAKAKLCRQSLENASIEVFSVNAPIVTVPLPR